MATSLSVTKQLTASDWTITATVTSDEIPTAIFAYENTGSITLGDYAGIISAVDVPRLQIWEGVLIPVFGNKYVRHTTGTIHVSGTSDPDSVITALKDSVRLFRLDYLSIQTSTEVFSIT
jgi:hypothetical protein